MKWLQPRLFLTDAWPRTDLGSILLDTQIVIGQWTRLFYFLHPFTLRTDPASDLSFVSDTLLSATILAYCPTTTKTSYVNLRLCSHCHWKSVGGPGRFDGKKGAARGTFFPLQKRQTPWQNPMAPNAIQSSNAPRCKCEQGLKYTLGRSFLEDLMPVWANGGRILGTWMTASFVTLSDSQPIT